MFYLADSITLEGVVVRELKTSSEEFPEYMSGVKIADGYQDTLRRVLEITDKIGDFLHI